MIFDKLEQSFKSGLAKAFEVTLNQYLKLDEDALKRFSSLDGHCIALVLKGLDIELYFLPSTDQITVLSQYDGEVSTTIKGAPLTLARLNLQETQEGFFGKEVEISGDLEAGRRFKQALDHVDVDWEEQLSKVIGDVAAHHLSNLIRNSIQWSQDTGKHTAESITEYLQTERKDVPHPYEMDTFLSDVDQLRSDVDRLAARVQRMQTILNSKRD